MRADRLLSIMMRLQANGRTTAAELATTLEVSERTIYRDIDALSAAGVPVYAQSGPNGGISLDEGYRTSLTGLTQEQVLSLFASTEAGPLADIGLDRAVEDSLLKLLAALPTRHRADVAQMRQRIHIDPAGWYPNNRNHDYLSLLQQAVWQNRQIEITYLPVGGDLYTATIDAYALVAKANIWYVVGRRGDGAYRTYRLSRLHALTLLDTPFDRDPDFDLLSYWRQSRQHFQRQMTEAFPVYPATLSVHPDMFWYFGSFLEGRFRVIGDRDEHGWIPVEVEFGTIEEAKLHLMGLSGAAWAIKPEALRGAVLAHAEGVVTVYRERLNKPNT